MSTKLVFYLFPFIPHRWSFLRDMKFWLLTLFTTTWSTHVYSPYRSHSCPSSTVIHWTNQSKADNSKLFCNWVAKLRHGWQEYLYKLFQNLYIYIPIERYILFYKSLETLKEFRSL